MANRYEKLCLAALKDLKVEVEWIVWIVGKVIRFMIRLFSLCCPSQWSCPTPKGIRQHYLIWRPEEVTKMDKWEDFDQIEADRLLAEQMQAQMTSSESEESGRSGQTSKIILCINLLWTVLAAQKPYKNQTRAAKQSGIGCEAKPPFRFKLINRKIYIYLMIGRWYEHVAAIYWWLKMKSVINLLSVLDFLLPSLFLALPFQVGLVRLGRLGKNPRRYHVLP